jgi:hypothetical protein
MLKRISWKKKNKHQKKKIKTPQLFHKHYYSDT